jgi:PAS domain S-box-containing protein
MPKPTTRKTGHSEPTRRATRRPAPPASGVAPAGDLPLLRLVAQATSLAELLPHLHRRALRAARGTRSLLFERNRRNGALQATSGYALEEMPTDPWIPSQPDTDLVAGAFSRSAPTLVAHARRQLPELARRLDADGVLLVPLQQNGDEIGLLAIGVDSSGSAASDELPEVADAFVTALELFGLRHNQVLQHDLRSVLDEFAGVIGATLNLSDGLEAFCQGATRVFGADRTAVWIHDRRAHHLFLRAMSDPESPAGGARVAVTDPTAAAAFAMRRGHAEIHASTEGPATTITVPLRGCRRALGTLVLEGVRIETGREFAVLDRADELGRQLSAVIENIQLLDDVVRSRHELENTFDSIAHLVAVWDRRGRIVHVNHAFARRVGLSRDELLDRPLDQFVGPKLRAWLAEQRPAEGAGMAESPVSFEVLDPILNGLFLITVTALRNHAGEQVGSVLVARDLTSQAKLQAEGEELRRRLLQSEKLAAVGQFVAGIAHELNNPLQGVLGHLELLRVTGAFPKSLRREVQTIYREADRAAKIVRNLLAFSGSRRSLRRRVSVNAVLQKVVGLRAQAHRAAQIEVVRHYDEKLPRVQSDPLLLHQVFLNILVNAEHAIAATGHSGRIEITTGASRLGERILVSVRDTGNGIPAEVLSRIFEPFYTTKEVGQGSGLGLAISYGIVQEHGGEIIVTNHPEGGAVFTIDLPIEAVRREEAEPASAMSFN